MKILLSLVMVLFLSGSTNRAYSPAFKADYRFNSEYDKFTYLSNKYKISALYYITNGCNHTTH